MKKQLYILTLSWLICIGCITNSGTIMEEKDCVYYSNEKIRELQAEGITCGIMFTRRWLWKKGHAYVWKVENDKTTYWDYNTDVWTEKRPKFVKFIWGGEWKW